MKAKQQTKNEKKKPQRKLPDLPPKKDVRGGGDFVITSTTDKSTVKL
jgi:hypothetical protein